MNSVIVSGFGVMLGKTSERLVVRGPRPRLELILKSALRFIGVDPPRRHDVHSVLLRFRESLPAE